MNQKLQDVLEKKTDGKAVYITVVRIASFILKNIKKAGNFWQAYCTKTVKTDQSVNSVYPLTNLIASSMPG